MSKVFGNVKGFDKAIETLNDEERSDLLRLIVFKEVFDEEYCAEHSEFYANAALALAAIYHANNGENE